MQPRRPYRLFPARPLGLPDAGRDDSVLRVVRARLDLGEVRLPRREAVD